MATFDLVELRNDGVEEKQWPQLKCSAANELEINSTVKGTAFQGDGSALTGKVSTAGDTMTGPLTIDATLNVNGAIASSSLSVTGNTNIGGNLTVSGNLEVNGVRLYAPSNDSLLIDGGTLGFANKNYKPFQLKKFSGKDNPRIDTGYPIADWVVIIAGFKVVSPSPSRGTYVYPYIANNRWYIAADVLGPQETQWEINLLAIRTSWVHLISKI